MAGIAVRPAETPFIWMSSHPEITLRSLFSLTARNETRQDKGKYTMTLLTKSNLAVLLLALSAPAPAQISLSLISPMSSTLDLQHPIRKSLTHPGVPPLNSVRGLDGFIQAIKAKHKREHPDKNEDEREKDREKSTTVKPKKDEDEDGTDYYEAWLDFLKQRAYPNDSIDWNAYARAEQQRDSLPAAHVGRGGGRLGAQNIGASWQFVGPNNLVVPYQTYYGVGILNGRTNALAYDPTNANILYVGSAGGGVWKSIDGGTSWKPLSDFWTTLRVSSLAVDPKNPQTIYAGTGDFPAGYAPGGRGLMKSTDGGANWTQLTNLPSADIPISAILVDPDNPNIVTVAGGRHDVLYGSLWRSLDGGNTWQTVLDASLGIDWSGMSIGAKAANGSRLYYAVGETYSGAIYVSTDRGASWNPVSSPATTNYQGSVSVATSKVSPNTIYMMFGTDQKIYRSTDAGTSWTDITSGMPVGNSSVGTTYDWSQNTYDAYLTTSTYPLAGGGTGDVLYAGLIDVTQWRQNVGWQSIGGPTYVGSSILHNDQHSLAVNPQNPNEALIGCDGGVFRYLYNPSNNSWTISSRNPVGDRTQYYRLAVHPTDPTRILGGAQDNATPAALGNLTNWANVGGGDGGFCAIKDSNTQFATSQFLGIYKTTNGWTSSQYISTSWSGSVAFIAPITLNPAGDTLYAGSGYLNKYTISSGTWATNLGGQALAGSGYAVRYIAVAPNNANTIYTGSDDGQMWKSSDSGATWTQIDSGTTSLPVKAITSIVVNPSNANDVFVTLSGTGSAHVWRCTNTAASPRNWTSLGGTSPNTLPDISTNAIALDPITPTTTYYVATDTGVFMTTDSGTNWTNATSPLGLPNVQVNDLKLQGGTVPYLYAGTYGRGIWRIPLLATVRKASGTITLQNCVAAQVIYQPVTFQFRDASTNAVKFTRTVTLGSGGTVSLTNLPSGNYKVAIKGLKWLQSVVPCNVTSGDATGLNATLLAGDADNNNIVDVDDLTLLLFAFNTAYGDGTGLYDVRADFDCNGKVDVDDLTDLLFNFNISGTP